MSEKSSTPSVTSNRKSKSLMERTQTESLTGDSSNSQTTKRLIWRDIYAELKPQKNIFGRTKKSEKRVLLDHVSGVAEPGQVTFLMGASGAGKTTLLNILTQRAKGIEVYGDVTVNKQEVADGTMRQISSYVQQEDIFMGDITVKETLMFAARLRMPRSTTLAQKRERVDEVVKEMGLGPCLNTRLAAALDLGRKTISRGEKKRLSFACEILNDPAILFCDEPTSGLDAYMALQVMRSLCNLAKRGKTIICSIHQPSSLVYEMADSLVLMALGRVAYQGPADQVQDFLKSCGVSLPQYISVPDHFMTVISKKEAEKENEYRTRVEGLIENFEMSSWGRESHNITHMHITSSRRQLREQDDTPEYITSWWTQFILLLVRALRSEIRNPVFTQVRIFQCTIIGIILGFVFFQIELTKDTIMSYKGIGFSSLRDMNILFLFPCIHVFTAELPVVYREYKSAMYHPSAYFMGKNLADSVQYFVLPTIYSTIVFWMSGIGVTFSQYACFWFICTMMALTATSVGYLAACGFGRLELAAAFVPLFNLPMLIFGGFFIDLRTVPVYFKPLTYLSWYKYAYEANMINIFETVGEIKDCVVGNVTVCEGANGHEIVVNNGLDVDYYWLDILALLLILLVCRCLALFALRIRVRRS